MKKTIFLTLIIATAVSGYAQKVEKLWETDTVFNVPESTLFDDSVVYISNINGQPLNTNKSGYISRITSKGVILQQKWITGLNAPKGMGIYNEKLYVSDINRVAIIDRKKGVLVEFIEIPNSKFLNDIAISESGLVAVSDMNDETVYFIQNNQISFSIKDSVFKHVNGLCWVGDLLYVGANSSIYSINLTTKKPILHVAKTGGIDGLEQLDENRFVISDWQGKVQIVSPLAEPVVLFNTTSEGKNAADIDLIKNGKIILVPTFKGNTVSAYQIIE